MTYDKLALVALYELLALRDRAAFDEVLRRFDAYILRESKVHGAIDEDVAQQARQAFAQALQDRFGLSTTLRG